jgi:hypothetical protein
MIVDDQNPLKMHKCCGVKCNLNVYEHMFHIRDGEGNWFCSEQCKFEFRQFKQGLDDRVNGARQIA